MEKAGKTGGLPTLKLLIKLEIIMKNEILVAWVCFFFHIFVSTVLFFFNNSRR